MSMLDPHSYADSAQPNTKHIELELYVDFTTRELYGTATLHLDREAGGTLDLDTRGLAVQSVTDAKNSSVSFDLGAADPIKGTRLRLHTTSDRVKIRYRSSPEAMALQWLEPAQTKGGKKPYLFTQCQAIHARTIVPCQDSPRVRITYEARLNIPAELKAVFAAEYLGREEAEAGRAVEIFRMPQAIPSYLLAFAVGNIASKDIGPRSRVYAEPEVLEAGAWELAGTDTMVQKAEVLFGPYVWDRFDILVMPPSFPYGGMENPRLTFLTPTVLAGDRSLVNVVAHELAHSWTGNLVTNANMNDFWLNEGFTVYAERRIIEALEGGEAVALHAALGRKHLQIDLDRLTAKNPRYTKLKTDLSGMHPDDVYSLVPYEKGYLFLRRVEDLVGRPKFDEFLKQYIARFSFKSITTEEFLAFFNEVLPDAKSAINLGEWIEGTGIPSDAPNAKSGRLERIEQLVRAWKEGTRPSISVLKGFDASEWQVFLSSLPKKLDLRDCAFLDDQFALSEVKNAEIRVAWLTIAASSGFEPAYSKVREALATWGRMKYLRPLYTAMVERGPDGKQMAKEIFEKNRAGYHPVAQGLVEGLLSR
jgi:leukotriene A-4 hydrolase/aminopeptidase